VAVVTGCAGGIAPRLVAGLVDRGYRVVATDIDLTALEHCAISQGWPQDQVTLRRLDVGDLAAWADIVAVATVDGHGLDLLVNVAGYMLPGYIHETPAAEIDRHLDVNLKGAVYGTMAVAPQMMRRRSGHIVNFASLAGIAAAPGISLYTASKFAVRGFSLAVAQELRPHGIAVTVVCPDAVDTPMLARQVDHAEAAMSFTRAQPLSPEQVAKAFFGRVLGRAPLEVAVPPHRGWLAKFASAFPAVAAAFAPKYMAKGRARQAALKQHRAD
jgi:3-oxoacyl-[acyl-carrier protein] reductase